MTTAHAATVLHGKPDFGMFELSLVILSGFAIVGVAIELFKRYIKK